MIEGIVRDFLAANMDVPVYLQTPKTHPNEYVVVEKTDSTRDEYIWTSTFAIQAYADTAYDAAYLMEDINSQMLDYFITFNDISAVELNNTYNYTDNNKKQPRYQSVFVITHY